jgi:hypothetical protein
VELQQYLVGEEEGWEDSMVGKGDYLYHDLVVLVPPEELGEWLFPPFSRLVLP